MGLVWMMGLGAALGFSARTVNPWKTTTRLTPVLLGVGGSVLGGGLVRFLIQPNPDVIVPGSWAYLVLGSIVGTACALGTYGVIRLRTARAAASA